MARLIVFLVLTIICLGIRPSAANLHLEASPIRVVKDITPTLQVNCSFSYSGVTNISNLMSLIISRADNNIAGSSQVFEDLASITSFDPDNVKLFQSFNMTALGHFDTGGVTYVSLQWTDPTLGDSGRYQCKAIGLDDYGRPVELSQLVDVAADNFDTIDSIARRLSTLETKLDQLIKTVGDSFTEINNRLSKVESAQKASLSPAWFIQSPEVNGRYYLLSNMTPASDNDAEASCILQGGYLAEIDDAAENAFVVDFVNTTIPDKFIRVLLGATDRRVEGLWEWRHSGRPVVYHNWHSTPNVPANNCMQLYKNYDWDMVDFYCTSYNSFVTFLCEIPVA